MQRLIQLQPNFVAFVPSPIRGSAFAVITRSGILRSGYWTRSMWIYEELVVNVILACPARCNQRVSCCARSETPRCCERGGMRDAWCSCKSSASALCENRLITDHQDQSFLSWHSQALFANEKRMHAHVCVAYLQRGGCSAAASCPGQPGVQCLMHAKMPRQSRGTLHSLPLSVPYFRAAARQPAPRTTVGLEPANMLLSIHHSICPPVPLSVSSFPKYIVVR